jgi:hypothetical protein
MAAPGFRRNALLARNGALHCGPPWRHGYLSERKSASNEAAGH